MTMRVTTESALMTIAFDRPGKKNAITAAMYQQMADALKAASADGEVRAVLFAGTDQCYTAGNDLEDFLRNPPHGDSSPVFQFLQQVSTCPKPIVAAPCGVVVGVGMTMLLHCDLVYAGDNARFSVPFTPLGLCPEAASSLLLPAFAGYQLAAEKLLLGEAFGADEAQRMGFVNRVLPAAEAIGFAREQALKLTRLPPASVRATKRFMKSGLSQAVPQRMAEEGETFRQMLAAPEAREAFTAFLQKRPPDFSRFA